MDVETGEDKPANKGGIEDLLRASNVDGSEPLEELE